MPDMNASNYDPLAAYSTPSLMDRLRALTTNKNAISNLVLALFLITATALLYGHSLWNPLVFDDKPFFIEAMLKQYGASVFHFDLRWFSYVTFGWTYNLFGLNWFWFHLGNLVLHALTSVLIFAFFYRLLAATSPQQNSATKPNHFRLTAFFAALVFALHPVSVYGVAYLVERSIIMATLFGIAMLLCYLEGLTGKNTKWFAASTVFYFLAVFSKEHSIMLPGVALALTLLIRKPSFTLAKQLWMPYFIYLLIGVFILLRTKGVLGVPYEPFTAEMTAKMSEHQGSINLEHAYPLSIITQAFLFFKYLLLWVIPYTGWMSVDVRTPFATQLFAWPEFAGLIAFLAYPALASRLLLKGGRTGLLGFAMLFPWVLYLTELSTVRIQEPFVLYRSYLWMSGLPIAILAAAGLLPRKTAGVAILAFCTLLAALAWNRLDTFSDNWMLWNDAVTKNPDTSLTGSERGYNNRGFASLELGRDQEALNDFKKAISLNPKYADAHLNVGIALFKQGKLDQALQSYDQAIGLKPEFSDAYLNRGVVLLNGNRLNDAIEDFNRTLQINPWNAEALSNRGLTYARFGRPQDGLSDLDKAIELSPKMAQARMNRGIVNAMLSRGEQALDDLNQAAKLDPRNAQIFYNRGNIHAAIRHFQEAMLDYDKATELNPNYADAYVNRGGLYMISSRLQDALAQFDKALSINPNDENAHLNRANIHAAQSRSQEALDGYEKVLSINPKNSSALLNRGLLLNSMRRQKEAMESFRKSCDAGNRMGCDKMKEAAH